MLTYASTDSHKNSTMMDTFLYGETHYHSRINFSSTQKDQYTNKFGYTGDYNEVARLNTDYKILKIHHEVSEEVMRFDCN